MKNTFLKDLLRVGLSNVLIIVSGLGVSIITARYLGPEKNGIIAALLVYPSLIMNIGSLGIRQSTTYFLGKNIYNEAQIKTAITQLWLFTSVVSIFLCFFLMKYFGDSTNNTNWILLSLIPLTFTLFNKYNSGIFLGKNDISTFNKINWIPSVIIFLFSFFFIVIFDWSVTGHLIALVTGPLLLFVVFIVKNNFIQSFSFNIHWKLIKDMLGLGIVYAIALLISNLNYKADVIILDKLSVPYQLGIYSKGANLTQYLWQIPMVLSTLVFARSAVSKNSYSFSLKVCQLLRLSILVISIASIILYFSSNFIINLFFGSEFFESSNVFVILLPGVVVLTIFKVMNMDLAGNGKPWVSVKAMLPALLINIALNIIYVPKYGANAAAWSSTITYSIGGILFIYFYSKETKISISQILFYTKSDFDPVLKILKYKK